MASIRKLKTKWEARVRLKGFPCYCKSFTKKSDAISWAREVEVGLETGRRPFQKSHKLMTFADAVQKYSNEISPGKKSHNSERYRLKTLLNTKFSDKKMTEVTPTDITDFRDERLRKVQSASVRKELYLISAIFTTAVKEWGISSLSNPIRLITIPKDHKPRVSRLSPQEKYRLIASLKKQRHHILRSVVEFALETGMRRSEIIKLKFTDIDLNNRLAVVRDTKNTDNRIIPLNQKATQIIQSQPHSNGQVFACSTNSLRLAWSRFQHNFGFKYLRFHDLRHEAISRLFELGLSVPEVALISGHKTKTQLFRYAHSDVFSVQRKIRNL